MKPLTTKEIALGIGRNFTEAELKEYLQRTYGGKGKTAANVLDNIKKAHMKNFDIYKSLNY